MVFTSVASKLGYYSVNVVVRDAPGLVRQCSGGWYRHRQRAEHMSLLIQQFLRAERERGAVINEDEVRRAFNAAERVRTVEFAGPYQYDLF